MDFYGQYPAGYVAGPQPYISPEPVFPGESVKDTELVLPGKTFDVTVCIRDYRNKYETFQLSFNEASTLFVSRRPFSGLISK
jgi:hypothetical protein